MSLAEGRKFLSDYEPSLDEEDYVIGIGVNSKDPMHIDVFNERLKQAKGLVEELEATNSALLFALQLENTRWARSSC